MDGVVDFELERVKGKFIEYEGSELHGNLYISDIRAIHLPGTIDTVH